MTTFQLLLDGFATALTLAVTLAPESWAGVASTVSPCY